MNQETINQIEEIIENENPLDRNSNEKFCVVIKKGILNRLQEITDKNYDFSSYIFSEFNDIKKIKNPKFYWLNYQINYQIEDSDYDSVSIKIKKLLETYFTNKNSIIIRSINDKFYKDISLKLVKAKVFIIDQENMKNQESFGRLENFKIPLDLNFKINHLKLILYDIIREKNYEEMKMIYLLDRKPFGKINYIDFKNKVNLLKEKEEKQIKNFSIDFNKIKLFVFCNLKNSNTDVKYLLKKTYNYNSYNNYSNTYNHENNGLCGLRNIGNTCYMNSALQCLSNTIFLKDYFISKAYKNDINNNNVLGYEGKIALSFENLLTNLWKTNQKAFNPNNFKKEISKTNPMFEGYHQNDSQEFLSHLIDSLHEDLNLIYKKPMTEQIEKNNINDNDYEIARKSWINHLKRNYSVINRLFYGQFKSEVNCPKCKKISITFDSFQIIPLSIPQIKEKKINFYINSKENLVDKICYNLKGLTTTIYNLRIFEIKKDFCESINEDPNDYFILNVDTNEIVDETKFNMSDIKNSNLDISIFKYSEEDKEILNNIPKSNQILVKINLINISYCMIMDDNSNIEDWKKRACNIFKSFMDYNEIQNYYDFIQVKKYEYNNDDIYKDEVLLKNLIKDEKEYSRYSYYNKNRNLNMLKFENKIEVVVKFEKNFNKKHNISDKIPSKYPNYNQSPVINTKNITFDNKNTKDVKNLTDLVDLFIEKEELDDNNKWYCNICKEHLKAIKKIDFYKLPPVLVFQMKKLKGEYSFGRNNKDENSIDFPIDSLDLSDYVKNDKNFDEYTIKKEEFMDNNTNINKEDNVDTLIKDNNNLEYELYGIINHFGSMNFGHYTAFCKHEDNEWYEYDDSSVNKIDKSKLVNSSAYILFYRKKNLK